jgi:hypothetical protein
VTTCEAKTATVGLGMANGRVYEIGVFQAERQANTSSFQLTLPAFNIAPSECVRL